MFSSALNNSIMDIPPHDIEIPGMIYSILVNYGIKTLTRNPSNPQPLCGFWSVHEASLDNRVQIQALRIVAFRDYLEVPGT